MGPAEKLLFIFQLKGNSKHPAKPQEGLKNASETRKGCMRSPLIANALRASAKAFLMKCKTKSYRCQSKPIRSPLIPTEKHTIKLGVPAHTFPATDKTFIARHGLNLAPDPRTLCRMRRRV